ncbi:unnamed protein product [Mucor fragilis]
MRKLFGANKKKKSSTNLKAGTLKIPIPMINGVEYADLTESQISTLIGGGNRDYHKKKLASSLSSQRTNNTTQTEKTPSNIPVQQQPVTPSRSISSPPILVMPKPMHSLPPTRYLLRSYDYEKTQVESSSDGSSSDSSEEEEEQEQEKEHRIMSSPLPLKTERKDEESQNHQSSAFVTRTSEDSIRQYVSASESPFPTASSIVSSMNQPNVATLSPSFSSPSSPAKYTSIGNDMNHTHELKRTTSSVPPPASSTFAISPAANDANVHDKQDTPKPPSSNSNEAVIQEFPLPPSSLYTTTEDMHSGNLPSIHEYNTIKSTTPPTKKRVSRPPTSSSGSSATVGHDVTHSQNRHINNNSDKPPGSLLQTISSESPAFHQNNNNSRMDSLTEMLQSEIKKMALNADLLELKRTVDRMQQQRVADLEDHLTRVAEQKLREMEILEQIKQTKQRLDMAIAEKMFTNKNSEEQDVPKPPKDDQAPAMKSSSSTNTTRSNKLRSGGSTSANAAASNSHVRHQHPQQPAVNKQRNRRSLPSAYQRLPAQNEYFPDMNKPSFEFDYPPQFGYPQDYDPEFDMMRMMNASQGQFVDPFAMDSPRGRYTHRKSSLKRRPRSKSMESQWQEQLDQDQHYMQQQQQQQQQHPHPPYPDMYPDGNFYYATPRTRSRKSSLRSAKSSSSDSDNNNSNKNDNFDQAHANSANGEESAMGEKPASARQQEMESDEDRQHAARHRSGSGRFRRGHPHPGAMGNMPPNMFAYPNGLPPLPHLMDRDRMKMRPPPPPPYGYNNMPPPPPPGNEYFSYMPPSQRISPRMMAALAADEQNQQQQQQQQQSYGGYQWGPPPQDQQAFGNRRFPPPPPSAAGQQQPNSLQQTPPAPPQGYISMYGERIYM